MATRGAGADRIVAFADAYLDYLLEHLDLVRMSETASPGARYRIGAYRFWHRHAAILLAATPDPEHAAHALLAPLAADHVAAILPELGEQRVRAGIRRLARSAISWPGAGTDTIQHMTPSDPGLPGNIGAPATRALTAAGYTELSRLAHVPAAELKKLHGVGPKALRLLQEALEQQGMSLS